MNASPEPSKKAGTFFTAMYRQSRDNQPAPAYQEICGPAVFNRSDHRVLSLNPAVRYNNRPDSGNILPLALYPVHTGTGYLMSAVAAVLPKRSNVNDHLVSVRDLILRVEILMSDERYPPLYIQKVEQKTPFPIRHRRN